MADLHRPLIRLGRSFGYALRGIWLAAEPFNTSIERASRPGPSS